MCIRDRLHSDTSLSLFLTFARSAFLPCAASLRVESSFRIEGFFSCVSFFAENSLKAAVSTSDVYKRQVTTHAAHVLDTQILHSPGFHFFHHCQKSGTVKAGAANAIVREMDNVCKALLCGELLQHCLLRRDLSRIISAKYNRFMEHITNKAFSVSFPFLHR